MPPLNKMNQEGHSADAHMSNHWHFVVWPERDGDLPAFMKQVTNTHVKRRKEHHHEIGYGHLYEGRYKCFPVETEDYSTRSFATWSGMPCVQTSWSERNRGVGEIPDNNFILIRDLGSP